VVWSHDRATPPDGVVGTDFRHAVEFSRSGRAPSAAFRLVSGATRVTLRGWLRGVKLGGLPHHPHRQSHTRRRAARCRGSREVPGPTRRTGSYPVAWHTVRSQGRPSQIGCGPRCPASVRPHWTTLEPPGPPSATLPPPRSFRTCGRSLDPFRRARPAPYLPRSRAHVAGHDQVGSRNGWGHPCSYRPPAPWASAQAAESQITWQPMASSIPIRRGPASRAHPARMAPAI
jgi:hypothetical protein